MKLKSLDYLDISEHFTEDEIMVQHTAKEFVEKDKKVTLGSSPVNILWFIAVSYAISANWCSEGSGTIAQSA